MVNSRIISSRTLPSLESRVSESIIVNNKAVFLFYIVFFTISEIASVLVPLWGILLHAVELVFMSIHCTLVRRINRDQAKLVMAITPVPIIRIASLISPVVQFTVLQWFLVISMVLFASIFTSIRVLGENLTDYGFKMPDRRHYPLEVFIVVCGFLFGFLENGILRPEPFVESLNLVSLLAPFIALYFGTGILEELLFRGVIQKHAIDSFGKWSGIIFTTLVFTIFHMGWESIPDLFFVGTVGFIFSLVVLKTGSLVGVSFSHAVTNLSLFVLTPGFLG